MERSISARCCFSVAPIGRTQTGCDWGWVPSDHTIHMETAIPLVHEGRSINIKDCKSFVTILNNHKKVHLQPMLTLTLAITPSGTAMFKAVTV